MTDKWVITPPLDEAIKLLEENRNLWWTLECGHHQNLFEDALDRIASLRARIALLEKVAALYSALFRGVTQDKQMLLLPKGAYEEIEAALDALKGDR